MRVQHSRVVSMMLIPVLLLNDGEDSLSPSEIPFFNFIFQKFLRRIAPQAIIILILTVLMLLGAVIFQELDPKMKEKPLYEVIFFEFITISTIGYGDQSPKTPYSKVFAILFSIFGIPLLVVTLGNFGKYLTKFYWKLHGLLFQVTLQSVLF